MSAEEMYTSSQIAIGTLFGSPLTGAAMMRVNFLATSDVSRARSAIFVGIAATVATIVGAVLVPLHFPSSIFLLINTGIFEFYARRVGMHKRALLAKGIPIMSNWRVAGISTAGLVITYFSIGPAIFWFIVIRHMTIGA